MGNSPEVQMLIDLEALRARLQQSKPEDRSGAARAIAVTITELEKVIAYYRVYVVEQPRP